MKLVFRIRFPGSATGTFVPEGLKLVAVGERCATPTDSSKRVILTLKGSHSRLFDPYQGQENILTSSVGVAQRSPTAINLNPSGIRTD